MQISFIVPPSFDDNMPAERSAGCTRMVYPMPNIYELTIAAIFEKENYKVDYFDFVIKNATPTEFEDKIKTLSADIFCFWSVNLSIETDTEAFSVIRKYHPNAWILFMGPAGTYFTDKLLFDKQTIIVRGEPDFSVLQVVKAIEDNTPLSEVKGISYLSIDNEIKKNQTQTLIKNLDDLPFPARHHIESVTYRNPKLKRSPYTSVVTSRNCPFQCIYCVPSSLTFAREIESKDSKGSKPPIYFRTPENVESELKLLAEKGYKSIAFVDDNFIFNTNRLRAIVDALNKYDFHWGCQARADAIDEETAQILGNSKCDYIDLGVESFNDEILKFIRKGLNREQIYNAIKLLNKYKVPVKLNILIGTSPLESKETIKETIREAKKLKVSQIMFNIVSPFPGTKFYSIAKENGWLKEGEYRPTDVQRHSILEYPHISAEEMERILFKSNLLFFLRPSIIWRHIKEFRSLKDLTSAFKALKIKFFG
ncbi:B12-binding domain-containing radical SAM protein [Carboxylicivirga marina]|uniref:B12-binding domain-containing radical SAM protein n=1 Tax=Carboxylicivirga marina TaxID=2800988 RepID=UPI00259808F1|nr:radical SAM protein [uncultured Carboxylicivirga sp.]